MSVANDPKESETTTCPTEFIDAAIGRRYSACRLDTFKTDGVESDKKRAAVEMVRDYVNDFPDHYHNGRSLILAGPKGTGKDHLMTAAIREIATRRKIAGRVVFRDGLRLFAEFRAAFGTAETEDRIVDRFLRPELLAISDPLPPKGALSEYEQRVLLRIIDGRYREAKPLAATVNAQSRDEVGERMGEQAADRLFDCAIVVKCFWPSYRTEEFK